MTSNSVLASALAPIMSNIIEPCLIFLFGAAFIYFLWGIFKLIRNADSEEERKTGANHILYSVIGMFVMLGAYGIIRLIANTFNLPLPF